MNRKVAIEIHEDDVRTLISNVVNLRLNRFSQEYQALIGKLGTALAVDGSEKISERVDELCDFLAAAAGELANLKDTAAELDDPTEPAEKSASKPKASKKKTK